VHITDHRLPLPSLVSAWMNEEMEEGVSSASVYTQDGSSHDVKTAEPLFKITASWSQAGIGTCFVLDAESIGLRIALDLGWCV